MARPQVQMPFDQSAGTNHSSPRLTNSHKSSLLAPNRMHRSGSVTYFDTRRHALSENGTRSEPVVGHFVLHLVGSLP